MKLYSNFDNDNIIVKKKERIIIGINFVLDNTIKMKFIKCWIFKLLHHLLQDQRDQI